jgi:hypothetical protein
VTGLPAGSVAPELCQRADREGEKSVKTLNFKDSRRDSGGKEAVTAE